MEIKAISVGSLYTNCYVIFDKQTKETAIIDPGAEEQKIIEFISKNKLKVKTIFLTHGHYDHVSAVKSIQDFFRCPVYISQKDIELYNKQHFLIKQMGGDIYEEFNYYDLEKIYDVSGEIKIKVYETPGHTQGSLCLEVLDKNIVFSGDTLFFESIGRTDLPGGNHHQILNSLKFMMEKFKDYKVFPGHGPSTHINYEQKNNPFVYGTL